MASSSADEGEVLMLEDPAKLRKLANILLHQEEALMDRFISEVERVEYLNHCNDCYDGVIELLQNSEDLVRKHNESEQGLDKVAEGIDQYIKYGINMSMQCIRNCTLRATCINKIKNHYTDLVRVTGELQANDVAGIKRLAEEVTLYKEYMWEYTNKCRSGSARALSKAFSSAVKQEGTKFSDLVTKHKNRLEFAGEFEELEQAQKLKVYNNIIEESRRATIPKIEVLSASMGVAVLVTAAGLIAFDIYEAEYKLEAVIRSAFSVASEIGAFAVQVAVEGAISSAAAAEFGLDGVLVVAASGFIAGTLAALIFFAASGTLLDMIFNSGGKVELPQTEMKFHKLDVPDGMAIAYLLDHEDN